MQKKKWYMSKTLIVNILAVLAVLGQMYTGQEVLNAEDQVALLGAINIILRFVTTTKLN